MARTFCTVSFAANYRVVWLSLLLSHAILSSQAQEELPCTSTPLQEDVFGRCTDISLDTLKNDANSLFGREASEHTQLFIGGTSDTVLQSDTFASFPELNYLNMVSQLSVIQRGAFSGLASLTVLGILSTNLSVLSISAFHLLQASPDALTLELTNIRDTPLVLNSDLGPFLMSLGDLRLDAKVVCDCHILWLIDVLEHHSPLPSGSVTCFSSITSIDGQDLRNVDVIALGNSCPDVCSTNLNECDMNNGNCTALTVNSIQCSCLPGFEGDGYVCEDIDECNMITDPCPQEQCSNTVGSYICEPCTMEEVLVNRSCVCRVGLIRSNITGECVCAVTGSVFNSDSGTCVCEDSLSVYDNATSTCLCSFGSSDGNMPGSCMCPEMKTEVGGRCICTGDLVEDDFGRCMCPGNKTEVAGSCVCPGELVKDQSGSCVCPGNTVLVGDSCICTGELIEYDTGVCACPGNKTEVNGSCVCSGELVENQSGECVCPGNKTEVAGSCVCPGELVEDQSGSCVCPGNTVLVDGSCVCTGELIEYDTGVCACPGNKTEVNGSCICSGELVENQSGECVCPGNTVAVGGSCMCPGELVENGSDRCVCPGNKTEVNSLCVCIGKLVEDQSGSCMCPGNTVLIGDSCVCTGELIEYDTGVCACPGNKTEVNGSCVCVDELIEGQSDLCVCPEDQQYSTDLGLCECVQGKLFNESIGRCVCQPPYQSNEDTGACECNGEGCPSALDQLLSQLNSQEPSLMSIQTVAEAAQLQVQNGTLEPGAITTLVSIISSSSNVLGNFSSDMGLFDVAESIVNLTSYLLTEEVVNTWISAGNVSSNVQSLLMAIETVAEALVDVANQSESGIVTIVTENIVLRVAIPKENSSEWQTFSTAALTGDTMTASNVTLPPSIVDYASCDAAIVSSAFQGVHRLLVMSAESTVTDPATEERILSGLCPARNGRSIPVVNSAILSTSIVADCSVNTSSIDDAVIISLYHENSSLVSPVCVSDGGVSGNDGLDLSGAGCMVISSTATRTECACFHLTSFAILMHPDDITVTFSYLNYASKAGLCLSIICLFLTVVILWIVKVKSDLPKVHRQLALSLLLTELVFLIGVDRQAVPSPDGLCTTFAAVVHYLLLVTFTWMLIEGVHMFIMIVVVFFSKKIYIVFYFLGWGLPIIIVVITLGVRFCDYGSTDFCWISSQETVWGAVLGPIIAVLLVNLGTLVIVTVVVIKAKRKQDKNANLVIVPLRTAIVLYPVLGLSWISGFLIFGSDPTYIQVVEWIFLVFVTLQGVVIFFSNCIFNKEVREALLKKLGCRETTLAPPSYHNMRRRSTMVSLKTSLRKMSVSSTRRRSSGTCGDITEMTLKETTNFYTVARPTPLNPQSPLSDVIVEEDELSTTVVDREPQRVDPATGMLESHCNIHAEYDD